MWQRLLKTVAAQRLMNTWIIGKSSVRSVNLVFVFIVSNH
jgi:hypothetical protein